MAPKGQVAKQIAVEENIPDNLEAHLDVKDPNIRPAVTSPEWNDFVLSHLLEEEYAEDKNGKKHPTTDGLRRVAEELFGELFLDTDTTQSPSSENGMVATARCIIETTEGNLRHVKEIADATPDNTDFPFSKFLTAIAGTRAEGRALRKFLRLRKVVTAEEIGSTSVDTEKKAVLTQVNVLKKMGEQYDINIWAFINKYLKEKWGNKVFNYINEVPYDFMLEPILANIQKYQQEDKDGNMVQVPEELKGYDANFIQDRWKS